MTIPDTITVESKHIGEVIGVANQLDCLLGVMDDDKYFEVIKLLEPLDHTLAVIAEEWRPLIEEKEEKELSKSKSEMEEDESL